MFEHNETASPKVASWAVYTGQIAQMLQRHSRRWSMGLLTVVCLLGAWTLWRSRIVQQQQRVQIEMVDVWQQLHPKPAATGKGKAAVPVPDSVAVFTGKLAATVTKWQDLQHRLQGSDASQIAAMFLAAAQQANRQTAEVLQLYQQLAQRLPPSSPLRGWLLLRHAAYLEDQNQIDAAMALLDNHAHDDTVFYAPFVQAQLARLYAAQHRPDLAGELWNHIAQTYPNSSLRDEVEDELRWLELDPVPAT